METLTWVGCVDESSSWFWTLLDIWLLLSIPFVGVPGEKVPAPTCNLEFRLGRQQLHPAQKQASASSWTQWIWGSFVSFFYVFFHSCWDTKHNPPPPPLLNKKLSSWNRTPVFGSVLAQRPIKCSKFVEFENKHSFFFSLMALLKGCHVPPAEMEC